MESRRSKRVADQIKNELGWLIEKKLSDPKKGFITLTRVKLSPDLKLANIYYSVLGDQTTRQQSGNTLNKANHFLRRELGRKVKLKYLPELRFFYDDSLDYSAHISSIIKKIHDDEDNQ
jgi:ribosome-binding factor A